MSVASPQGGVVPGAASQAVLATHAVTKSFSGVQALRGVDFTVGADVSQLTAKIKALGLLGNTGNPLNLVLTAPDGTRHTSGVSVLFALYPDRTVTITDPQPGTWRLEAEGINGLGLPETVTGHISLQAGSGFTGLNDIAAHPAASAIKLAVSERLVDGDSDRRFRPDEHLSRGDLARYLVMGVGVRQSLGADPFAAAVTARGAALRDLGQSARGVILPAADGSFAATQSVRRADLAYSLVQALGLEAEAQSAASGWVTVQYGDQRIALADAGEIPADLRGYVQLALDLNILNAYFSVSQGPFDLQPTVTATFRPLQKVTRGEYAVAAVRFFAAYLSE